MRIIVAVHNKPSFELLVPEAADPTIPAQMLMNHPVYNICKYWDPTRNSLCQCTSVEELVAAMKQHGLARSYVELSHQPQVQSKRDIVKNLLSRTVEHMPDVKNLMNKTVEQLPIVVHSAATQTKDFLNFVYNSEELGAFSCFVAPDRAHSPFIPQSEITSVKDHPIIQSSDLESNKQESASQEHEFQIVGADLIQFSDLKAENSESDQVLFSSKSKEKTDFIDCLPSDSITSSLVFLRQSIDIENQLTNKIRSLSQWKKEILVLFQSLDFETHQLLELIDIMEKMEHKTDFDTVFDIYENLQKNK